MRAQSYRINPRSRLCALMPFVTTDEEQEPRRARTNDEQKLRRTWDNGDFNAVTTLAIERYGPEILGILIARFRSESDASDAYSEFMQDLWRGVPGFQWRCSLRAWAHRIARHAAVRWATAGQRPPAPNMTL